VVAAAHQVIAVSMARRPFAEHAACCRIEARAGQRSATACFGSVDER
jgi:hypothetical protein